MTTWIQTAAVLRPYMAAPEHAPYERPVLSAAGEQILSNEDCTSVSLVLSDTEYTWHKDGTVFTSAADGTKTIFPARPTYDVFLDGSYVLSEFFRRNLSVQTYSTGNYIEFSPNESILFRTNGTAFFWGPKIPGTPLEGKLNSTLIMTHEEFWISHRKESYS